MIDDKYYHKVCDICFGNIVKCNDGHNEYLCLNGCGLVKGTLMEGKIINKGEYEGFELTPLPTPETNS